LEEALAARGHLWNVASPGTGPRLPLRVLAHLDQQSRTRVLKASTRLVVRERRSGNSLRSVQPTLKKPRCRPSASRGT
jgi:hypothetical protein